MNDSQSEVAELASEAGSAKQVADAACQFEKSRTGFAPASVTAVLENHSMVITLHGVLSSAEKDLTKTPDGADQVRDLHRQIFRTSCAPLRKKMETITGVAVLEATSETNPDTDSVVQVFRLAASVPSSTWNESMGELTSIDASYGKKERVLDGEG